MMRWMSLVWLALMAAPVSAQPAKVIILRHAEKPADESKESLSIQRQERAIALVPLLTQTPELIGTNRAVALFATRISERSTNNHTHETLEPLAARLGLKIRAPFANSEYQALAERVLMSTAC